MRKDQLAFIDVAQYIRAATHWRKPARARSATLNKSLHTRLGRHPISSLRLQVKACHGSTDSRVGKVSMKIVLRCSAGVSMCLLALAWSPRLSADVTGSIVGAVRDSSGRVIPSAQVVTTEVDTNVSKGTSSESDGQYHLLALPPGRYRITVSVPGFQQFVTNDVDLKVNDQLRIDATVSPGAVEERVTVKANAVQVETESTQLGGTLAAAQIL